MLASVAEASISVTSARAGNSAGVTLVQVAPLSRVSWTIPVLPPTQISPACAADGVMVSITPDDFSDEFFAVKSELISAHVSPLSVEDYHRLGEYNQNGRRTELIRGILIEKMSRLLGFADAEIIEALCYHLRDMRVTLRLNEEVKSVEETPEGVSFAS